MPRTAPNVWTLLLVMKTFLSEDDTWFRMYVMDMLEFMKDCFIGQALNNGHIRLLAVPTERHEAFEDV